MLSCSSLFYHGYWCGIQEYTLILIVFSFSTLALYTTSLPSSHHTWQALCPTILPSKWLLFHESWFCPILGIIYKWCPNYSAFKPLIKFIPLLLFTFLIFFPLCVSLFWTPVGRSVTQHISWSQSLIQTYQKYMFQVQKS